EDVIATEHLRTGDERTAAPVLDHIAFKKRAGTSNFIDAKMSRTLNGVAGQVAETCGVASDSPVPAADSESLQGHLLRVLDIDDRQASVGVVDNRRTLLGDQCQSIHTLNHQISLATARNSYPVRALRIGFRQQVQDLTNRFVFVAIHSETHCRSV